MYNRDIDIKYVHIDKENKNKKYISIFIVNFCKFLIYKHVKLLPPQDNMKTNYSFITFRFYFIQLNIYFSVRIQCIKFKVEATDLLELIQNN